MSRLTTILLSESVGVLIFSASVSFITYFQVKNGSLPMSGSWLDFGGDSLTQAYISSIFAAWAGLLVGGIIGISVPSRQSDNQVTSNLVILGSGIIGFLLLFSFFVKSSKGLSVFILEILIISLAASFLTSFFASHLACCLSKPQSSGVNIILSLFVALALPLITPLIFVLLDFLKHSKDSDFFQIFFFPVILVVPPMLVVWGILILINETIYKTSEIN